MKNIGMRVADGLLVVAHNAAAPTDAEWETFVANVRAAPDRHELRVLVFTEGAAPNTLQRDRLNKSLAGATPRIAVVSAAKLVRTVGAALSWFNPRFKVFNPEQLEQALAHLDLRPTQRTAALTLADEARREVGTLRPAEPRTY